MCYAFSKAKIARPASGDGQQCSHLSQIRTPEGLRFQYLPQRAKSNQRGDARVLLI